MCNCIAEIEDVEAYENKQGKEVAGILIEQVSLLYNPNTGKTRRGIALTLRFRYKGKAKDQRQKLIPSFCPFCGQKVDE